MKAGDIEFSGSIVECLVKHTQNLQFCKLLSKQQQKKANGKITLKRNHKKQQKMP